MTRKYFVRTHGCQMNVHDSERIAGLLGEDGLEPAEHIEDADVIVFNTCCIRENADNHLYGELGRVKELKDRKPDLQIAVGGCLAQKDRSLVQQRAPWTDVVFGTHNVGKAAELLRRSRLEGPITEILEESEAFPSALPVRRDVPYSAWVTIQIGCDNKCAFCIVPSVRGSEISRPFGDVLREVRTFAEEGAVEVTLLGQNVNSYGRDLALANKTAGAARATEQAGATWAGSRRRARPLFSDLLRQVGAIEGIRRVRYTSPHPKDLRPETVQTMAEVAEVCNHLHFPLQSGSDRVLSRMHRGYTAERYLAKLALARAGVDDLAVTTDIIVGFPGETEDDFRRTLEVAAEAEYDSAYTFMFSPRSGTEAAELGDQFVPKDVVSERFERLNTVVQRSALVKHENRIGKVEEVLVEGPSKRDPNVLTGRTTQNKLVHFATASPIRPGSFARVRVSSAAPHHLLGDLVEVTEPPRHRTHIPVAVG